MSRTGRRIATSVVLFAACAVSALCPPAEAAQPVAYSHKLHVSGYKIDCLFCHIYATKTATAGIPSVEKCMICHRVVATDKPEIRKVARYRSENKPIPWARVTELPDFTYFPHFRMVNAGIACLTCHPGMDAVDAAVERQEFTMGFCLKCHRSRGVSIDCWTCHI